LRRFSRGPSRWVPPALSCPGAPTNLRALPRSSSAVVHLTPPADDGGSAITSYTVTASPGGATASGPAWPLTVTGLANGTTYTFTARATNASGQGPASSASNSVTPVLPVIVPAVSSSGPLGMALDAHGQVYAWGNDARGQLGQGRQIFDSSPVKVDGLPAIQQISLYEHALAIDTSGQVWSWGNNCGGLGSRDTASSSRPARVIGATGMIRVAAGACQSHALRSDGTVWMWDSGGMSQMGFPAGIVDISSGGSHLLALRNDGTVYAWGTNTLGEFGNGTTGGGPGPVQVPGLAGVVAIDAGANSSLALLTNGELWFWGRYSVSAPPRDVTHARDGSGGYRDRDFDQQLQLRRRPIRWHGVAMAELVDGSDTGHRHRWGGQGRPSPEPPDAVRHHGRGRPLRRGLEHRRATGAGQHEHRRRRRRPGFATGTSQVRIAAISAAVVALKSDGTVWFWGANEAGQRGDGASIGSSVPLAVPIAGTVKAIATGNRFGIALDTVGQVWGWGENFSRQLDANGVSRSLPAVISGGTSVAAIAAGSFNDRVALAKIDGTAWYKQNGVLTQATGLTGIVDVAASDTSHFFLRNDGVLYAQGGNTHGELGDGTTTFRTQALPVLGISGTVKKVAAQLYRVCALMTDGRVYTWGSHMTGASLTNGTNLPVLVPGISDAVDITVGMGGAMVRRADGSILAWGFTLLSDGPQTATTPFPVAFHESVQAFALGWGTGILVGSGGLTWGWGNPSLATSRGSIGDGTYVIRTRPSVLLAHAGSGSVDGNNWYLDLQPASSEAIPAADIPAALATSTLYGDPIAQADGNRIVSLGLEGTVKYRSADYGKRVGNYVVALVPPTFLAEVKAAAGTSSMQRLEAKAAKTGGYVLVHLTPAGWTDVSGQLLPFSQGVANAAGSASNILNNINASSILGARFCVGYGETANAMLSAAALREVLLLEGAASTSSGVPCVLSGVYIGGPSSSVQSSPVTFGASVVGIAPTGNVHFRDGTNPLGAPAVLVSSNSAVSTASITTSSLSPGTHSIGAGYTGDTVNPPAVADLPKLHTVSAASQVSIEGPASSELGSEVAFMATVTGSNPGGTVQFKDGASSLGAPAAVVGGVATLRTSALGLGGHTISAAYSGDGPNAPSTSSGLAHTVANVVATSVLIGSSANPINAGASVTISVTVQGTNPGGSVALRDGAALVESKSLSGGTASFTLGALAGGLHRISAHYSATGPIRPPAPTRSTSRSPSRRAWWRSRPPRLAWEAAPSLRRRSASTAAPPASPISFPARR
jgi:alpha-tubulin suppressor-like RCC1 family protein